MGCRSHGDRVCIQVCDTGPGIPRDQQEAIFAEFQRGDARSADGFGRNELDEVSATLASYNYALALDVLKEGPLLWPVNVPKAEIVLVCAHLKAPPQPIVM